MSFKKCYQQKIAVLLAPILYRIFCLLDLISLKIVVGCIYSSRIGHLCFNSENIIDYYSRPENKAILLFILDRKIANRYVVKLLSELDGVLFLSHRWQFLHSILLRAQGGERFIMPWSIAHEKFNSVGATRKRIRIDPSEINILKSRINEYCRASSHVCIHNRDNSYLKREAVDDENYHDYRNFEFSTFRLAVRNLFDKGLCPVRIGKIVEVAEHDFEYFDLSGSMSSEKMDVVAIASAKFLVTGNTGLSQIARLCRTPILALNYCPFRVEDFHALTSGSMVVPKLIYDLKEQRFLNLNELISLARGFDIHYKGDFFKDNGFLVVDNDEDVISMCILEFNEKIDSSIDLSYDPLPTYIDHAFRENCSKMNITLSQRFIQKYPFLVSEM